MVQPIQPSQLGAPVSAAAAAPPPAAAQPRLAADRVQTSGSSDAPDARRDRMFQQQLARLGVPADLAASGTDWKAKLAETWQSWTEPGVDPRDLARVQVAAIDNLVALQDKRAFSPLRAVALRDETQPEVRRRAWEALAELAPYFDSRDALVLPEAADFQLARMARESAQNGSSPQDQQAFNRLWAIKTRAEGEVTRRKQGGRAKEQDVNLVLKNYKDAAVSILKTPVNIALGLAKTVVQDPVKAPTRLAYGMGSSLVHAVADLPAEVAGLATAGKYGAAGDELGDKIANTLLWAAPVAGRIMDRQPVPTDVAAFKAVQEQAGGKITRIMYGPEPNWVTKKYHQFKLGADNVEYLADDAKPRKVAGAVWHEGEWDARTVRGDVNLAHESFKNYNYFDNKLHEAVFLERFAPGSVPKTVSIRDLAVELKLKSPTTMAEKLNYLKALEGELRTRFPNGYILKDVKACNTGGNLPTDKTDLATMYKGYVEKFVPFEEKIVAENKDPNFDIQNKLREHEFHAGATLDALLESGERVIVQEKVKLSRYTNKELPRHIQPFNEFRIHVVKGQVLKGGSSHRWGIAQTMLQAENMKKAEAFAQAAFDKFPREVVDRLSFAPDVALLEDGSFTFIELNVGGASGFLTRNPFAADALAEAMTGRETARKALIKSGATGVVAGTLSGSGQDAARRLVTEQ